MACVSAAPMASLTFSRMGTPVFVFTWAVARTKDCQGECFAAAWRRATSAVLGAHVALRAAARVFARGHGRALAALAARRAIGAAFISALASRVITIARVGIFAKEFFNAYARMGRGWTCHAGHDAPDVQG